MLVVQAHTPSYIIKILTVIYRDPHRVVVEDYCWKFDPRLSLQSFALSWIVQPRVFRSSVTATMPPRKSTRSAKGKQVEPEPAAAAAPPPPAPEEVEAELTTEQPAATTDMEEQEALQEGSGDAGLDLRERDDAPEAGSSSSSGAAAGVDLSERMNKLKELRKRMVSLSVLCTRVALELQH